MNKRGGLASNKAVTYLIILLVLVVTGIFVAKVIVPRLGTIGDYIKNWVTFGR